MLLFVRLARLAIPAALLTLGACRDEGLTARDVYGVYVLELSPEALAAGYSDTLTLENQSPLDGGPQAGRHRTTYLERRVGAPAGSAPDSLVVREALVSFELDDEEVILLVPCEPAVSCLGVVTFRGPLSGDRLTLHPPPYISSPSRHYRRVAR